MDYRKAFSLENRVALVTGGGSGIGKGSAIVLAQAGAKVMIVGRRESKLIETKSEIEKADGICEYISADLSEEDECKRVVDQCIALFGRLDIVVNSAGSRGAHGTLEEELSIENYENTMNADFKSTFMVNKYAYTECAKNGVGSMINIASLAALAARGPVVYSAAKGAVKSYSKTLAKRLGSLGVRVNVVYPGFIVTEMTERIHEMPEMEEKMKSESPLNMLGEVEDIAYCVLYLASDASRFVTGQDFVIDGGVLC